MPQIVKCKQNFLFRWENIICGNHIYMLGGTYIYIYIRERSVYTQNAVSNYHIEKSFGMVLRLFIAENYFLGYSLSVGKMNDSDVIGNNTNLHLTLDKLSW